ncbi:MAG: peptide chain release factor N(5)-glutamine methyltransferase [Candidatus Dormibacteria bacterium]
MSAADPAPGPTLLDILRRSTQFLAQASVASPRLDAELILGHVLGLSRIELYLQFERPLLELELSPARELLRRRVAGCPVAYLVGEREFRSLRFQVSAAVLIPRPESELLVELGAARVVEMGGLARVLDLGCGSGCLGISLAKVAPLANVDLVDLSQDAVELAARNADAHEVRDRVWIHQGSWADPVRERGPYDLVLTNPPYVTTAEWEDLDRGVRDFEPRLALDGGPDGLTSYRELFPALAGMVGPGALILLEGDPRRLGQVAELAAVTWPTAQAVVHRDLSHQDRVLEVRLP